MQRLRRGDSVVVISGEEKGKRGVVKSMLPSRGLVIVEGINNVKRHLKPSGQRAGGILEVEAPIPACKLMLVDPNGGAPTRVRYKTEDGKKSRVAKSGVVLPVEKR